MQVAAYYPYVINCVNICFKIIFWNYLHKWVLFNTNTSTCFPFYFL